MFHGCCEPKDCTAAETGDDHQVRLKVPTQQSWYLGHPTSPLATTHCHLNPKPSYEVAQPLIHVGCVARSLVTNRFRVVDPSSSATCNTDPDATPDVWQVEGTAGSSDITVDVWENWTLQSSTAVNATDAYTVALPSAAKQPTFDTMVWSPDRSVWMPQSYPNETYPYLIDPDMANWEWSSLLGIDVQCGNGSSLAYFVSVESTWSIEAVWPSVIPVPTVAEQACVELGGYLLPAIHHWTGRIETARRMPNAARNKVSCADIGQIDAEFQWIANRNLIRNGVPLHYSEEFRFGFNPLMFMQVPHGADIATALVQLKLDALTITCKNVGTDPVALVARALGAHVDTKVEQQVTVAAATTETITDVNLWPRGDNVFFWYSALATGVMNHLNLRVVPA